MRKEEFLKGEITGKKNWREFNTRQIQTGKFAEKYLRAFDDLTFYCVPGDWEFNIVFIPPTRRIFKQSPPALFVNEDG